MITIDCNIQKVDKIIHLADIHIRLYKRHKEYVQVFENLYEKIMQEKTPNTICIVAGDLVHSKVEMSPELIDVTSNFLRNLADRLPTIVIAGNHDCNLNNMQRLDALSPIISNLKHSNLFYLRYTDLYRVENTNLVFSVMSIFDKKENYILAQDIPDDYRKVALFHGAINNASTDTGYQIKNDKLSVDLFRGFDAAILGDIHKYQNLYQYATDTTGIPNIVYPSSLIQQNHGESLNHHGFVVWDANTFDYTHVEVKNPYGYVTLEMDNGKLTTKIDAMPEKPRMRLKVTNSSASQIKDGLIDIRKLYTPEEVLINRIPGVVDKKLEEHVSISNIRDVTFQNELIKDYINRNSNVGDDVVDKIFEINTNLNKQLPTEEVIRNIIWKPKVFTFSNMFSYGEDNVIDFSKMNGIVGLFQANASGKSSLLDALTFCIFDKCSKAFKAQYIMNNRKDNFYCKFNFEIDGIDYFIEKSATRGKNDKVSVKIDFYKVTPEDPHYSLNGDARRDTSAQIRSYIGSYEDFNLTALSSQKNNANFIDMGQTERKDLLGQFTDISIFDKLYDLGNNEIKEYSVLLKQFETRDFDEELSVIDVELLKLKPAYATFEARMNELIKLRDVNTEKILELTKQIIQLESTVSDVGALERKKVSITENMEKAIRLLENFKNGIAFDMDAAKTLRVEIDALQDKGIEDKYNELVKLEAKSVKLQAKIDALKVEVSHRMDKADKLLKLKYDPNCAFCMDNIFVKDAIEAKKTLEDDKQQIMILLQERADLLKSIESSTSVRDDYDTLQVKLSDINKLKMEVLKRNADKSAKEAQISSYQSELEKLTNDIDGYYKSKEAIESNRLLSIQISNISKENDGLDTDISLMQKKLLEVNSRIMLLEERNKTILSEIEQFYETEKKYTAYEQYLKAINRDGIPYELVAKYVPKIETEINNILSQIVDFSVLLDLDGKNVNAKIVYDENKFWPIELVSGMEKFITGLAIRVALINISNLPRPTFLAIDEGFSTLDGDNMSNLPVAFDYFKTQFDFIFIISHLDHIRDFVDISLDLQKIDDFSKIVFK